MQNPTNEKATAALGQVSLSARVKGTNSGELTIRYNICEEPNQKFESESYAYVQEDDIPLSEVKIETR